MNRLLGAVLFALVAVGVTFAQTPCASCVSIRVGRPWLERSPDPQNRIADNFFNEVALSGGGYRGFSANGYTMSMDGTHVWDMTGPLTLVLSPGSSGSFDSCGRWLNDNYQDGSTLFGFYHAETNCNYPSTHKSMGLATSTDQGHTWSIAGKILDSNDSGTTETGFGDCTAMYDSSYHYLYCKIASNHDTAVARAPLGNPYPGNWHKYYNGTWSGDAFAANQADSLGYIGSSISMWSNPGYVVLLQSEDSNFHGVKMSLASDWIHFSTVQEPVVYQDASHWGTSPNELLAYPSAIDASDGNRRYASQFELWFTYLPPNGSLSSSRMLGVRDVTLTLHTTPQSPQVGVELSRWLNTTTNERWSTTGPVCTSSNTSNTCTSADNFTSGGWSYQGGFGYLMTKQLDPSWIKIVDCRSNTPWPGHWDHLTTSGSCDSNYTLWRTAGWAYPNGPQPTNTVAIYRCFDNTLQSHFVSNQSDCEGLGTEEFQIGYALAN